MIELYNFIRVKSIAERKRNSIKGCTSAAHKAKQDTSFQSRAGSPEAMVLGDSSGQPCKGTGLEPATSTRGDGQG